MKLPSILVWPWESLGAAHQIQGKVRRPLWVSRRVRISLLLLPPPVVLPQGPGMPWLVHVQGGVGQVWSPLGDSKGTPEIHKIDKNCAFSKSGKSKKSRNVNFLKTRAPAGAPLTERSFWKLTQIKLIHLKEISEIDIFQKSGILKVFYQSKSIFYRKLKWSVWSI